MKEDDYILMQNLTVYRNCRSLLSELANFPDEIINSKHRAINRLIVNQIEIMQKLIYTN